MIGGARLLGEGGGCFELPHRPGEAVTGVQIPAWIRECRGSRHGEPGVDLGRRRVEKGGTVGGRVGVGVRVEWSQRLCPAPGEGANLILEASFTCLAGLPWLPCWLAAARSIPQGPGTERRDAGRGGCSVLDLGLRFKPQVFPNEL